MAKEPTPKIQTRKHLARLERERIQRRYLLIATGVVVFLVAAIILYGVLDQAFFQKARPVAIVGGETITAGEFQKQVRYSRSRMIEELFQYASNPLYIQFMGSYVQQLQTQLASKELVGQQVLDSMIENVLIVQEAERRGITVTEEELDKAFEEAFGYFENGTPTPENTATPFVYSTSTLSPQQLTLVPPTATATETPEGTETADAETVTPTAEATATAEAAATESAGTTPTAEAEGPTSTPQATATITPTPTPYTREGFETQVALFVDSIEQTGVSRADLRELIRLQILQDKVFDAVTADVSDTGEQIWARHILVADQTLASIVIERLKNGEPFDQLARELSQDTGSAQNGGDLGWFGRGRMVAPFEEAAFNLEIGEISEPVQSDFGYHVIQLLGKEERPMTEEEKESARTQAYQEWLEQAKADTNITTYETTWKAVVPAEPVVPPEINAAINQAFQEMQQQQQTLPEDLFQATAPADDGAVPEPAATEQQ